MLFSKQSWPNRWCFWQIFSKLEDCSKLKERSQQVITSFEVFCKNRQEANLQKKQRRTKDSVEIILDFSKTNFDCSQIPMISCFHWSERLAFAARWCPGVWTLLARCPLVQRSFYHSLSVSLLYLSPLFANIPERHAWTVLPWQLVHCWHDANPGEQGNGAGRMQIVCSHWLASKFCSRIND